MTKSTTAALGAVAALALAVGAAPAQAQQDARDTLRVAMYSKAPTRGNPYGIPSIWPSNFWWEPVFDSFVRIDDKVKMQPMAAEKWELVNPTTWRVTFRKEAEFTTGRKNDAANVVKIFDYLHGDVGKVAGIMRNMKLASYKAIDSHTVEFVTQQPDPLVMEKFAAFYIIDMQTYNEMGAAEFASKPAGSGPWRVTSWNDQELIGTAWDKSWRPAKAKNLKITEIPEVASRVAALESNQIDIAFNLGPDDIGRLKSAGQDAIVTPGPLVESLAMFTKDFSKKWPNGKTPFSDKRVRLAANMALNRKSLTEDFFKGIAKPANQPATPQVNGYNPAIPQYPYDPVKAKALLAEAGYPNGFSVIMETGTGMAGGRDTLQFIANDLAKVGINIELRAMPFSNWSILFNQQKWEGDITAFAMLLSPVMDSSVIYSVYDGCTLPHGMVCIPELVPLIQAQEKEMDPVKRKALLQQLTAKAHEEVMSLPIIEGIDITGVNKRVKGFQNFGRVVPYENFSIN